MIALTTSGLVVSFTPPRGLILMPTTSSGVKSVRQASAVFFTREGKHPFIDHFTDDIRLRLSVLHNATAFNGDHTAFFTGKGVFSMDAPTRFSSPLNPNPRPAAPSAVYFRKFLREW